MLMSKVLSLCNDWADFVLLHLSVILLFGIFIWSVRFPFYWDCILSY